MISIERIYGVVLRHLRLFTEINRMIWTFYWPLLDMFLFGFGSMWLNRNGTTTTGATMMLAGVVFWQIVNRASVEASVNLLEEIWALNMLNLFATSLKLIEWIIAIFILAFIMCSIVMLYCTLAAYIIYGSPLIFMLHKMIPFLFVLFIAGLWLGFFGAALVMYYGARVQWIPWMLGWLFAPFCSALYPISVLPPWAQKYVWFLPMTPAFEGIRTVIETGVINTHYLVISFAMASCYCSASLLLLAYLFHASKQRGFARLTAD